MAGLCDGVGAQIAQTFRYQMSDINGKHGRLRIERAGNQSGFAHDVDHHDWGKRGSVNHLSGA